jgi:hypothetical protein
MTDPGVIDLAKAGSVPVTVDNAGDAGTGLDIDPVPYDISQRLRENENESWKRFQKELDKFFHATPGIEPDPDPVNPAHYKGDYVMRIIEDFHLDFLDGQVIKYILRAGKKAGASDLDDHKKAAWYLGRKIKNMGKGE